MTLVIEYAKGLMKAFRDLIINIGEGCRCNHRAIWLLYEGQDQPIPKLNMLVTLATPIKPGFRRPLTLVPDEALDAMPGGVFATAEILSGDATFVIDATSTNKSIKAWAYGDGAIGENTARVHADGHIGEGAVEVTLDIAWTVNHPDATAFGPVQEGPDEPIPEVPPVVV